ncbi:TetR/AcrR family transcriptional regulator [Streptomyces kanamyceticus]|uniref:TetR/AcrR family transcriptional regulator n=1 Tax=Streptomyces kanamyceticus TaxID=1967 RepID=A0A5J6G6I0_STRKN|nr:TetR/AcrR family transcriptional regulator [Streptomyces kanamyceticus]QEU89585.1 TetR/AcrR family transcriptional regulator [Streptomyces kanamyceticus]
MSRPSRADAERNRLRVLEVAEELFAERGDAVQMAEVARAAGVGVGTVYRHFPNRQALVEAITEQRFAKILTFVEQRCLPQPDTHQALVCFLTHVGEVHEQGRGLSGVIEATFGSTAPRGEVGGALLAVGETLVRRGRADGALREDVTVADLYMTVGAVAILSRDAIGDWRRFIDITLNGLRPR